MIVAFSTAARVDLRGVAAWIARDNRPRALTFVRELRDECESIGDHPRAFPAIGRFRGRELRRRAWRNYPIFYEVQPERILLARVLHGARDYEALLSGVS
jgi:toxin ParE1/3/4